MKRLKVFCSVRLATKIRLLVLICSLSLSTYIAVGQELESFRNFENSIEHLNFKNQIDTLVRTYEFMVNKDHRESMVYLDRAIDLCKQINYREGLALHLMRKGNYFLVITGDYLNAEDYLLKSLEVALTLDDKRLLPGLYNRLGGVNFGYGKFEESILYFNKARSVAEELGRHDEILNFSINLAVIEMKLEHYEIAKRELKSCLDFSPDNDQLSKIYNNLGICNARLKVYDSAVYYYQQSMKFCGDGNNGKRCKMSALNNIAVSQIHQGKDREALKSYATLEEIARDLGQTQLLSQILLNQGISYYNIEEYDSALEVVYQAKSIAKRNAQNLELKTIYLKLSEIYDIKNDFDSAFVYYKHFINLKDSLNDLENTKNTEDLIAKYESEKKEKKIILLQQEKLRREVEIRNKESIFNQKLLADSLQYQKKENEILALKGKNEVQQVMLEKNEIEKKQRESQILLLQKEKELKTAEAAKQSLFRNAVIIGALFLLLPAAILLYVFRQKIRDKELLAAKTEEINKQKTLEAIRDYELKAIKASIEGQERERRRIALELHDGIAGNLAGIKLMLTKAAEDTGGSEALNGIVNKIDSTYQEVRTITHHLTPPNINNSSFCFLIEEFLNDLAASNAFDITFICHPKKSLDQLNDDVKIEIYRIIQELMSNILKHAKSQRVDIQLIRNDQYVNLMIEDNGVGFDTVKARSGKGIGLQNILTRVSKLDGSIDIDSTKGRGTIVNIDIPAFEVKPLENV